ncbi:MAG TPA: hypothetical protein VGU44_02790 [Gammaproteobacteria bacterium]|nr:hypothetical protein [Gammaproteobacteria bacterium]
MMCRLPIVIRQSSLLLTGLLFYANEAFAVNASALVTPTTNFIQQQIMNNVGTVAVLAAFVVGIVMAMGQQIGKFVLNNLGYLGYVAFGGTIATGALTAAGITLRGAGL